MKSIGPADYARLERFFADQRYPLSPYTLASILVWSNKLYRPFAAEADRDLVVGYELTVHPEDRHLLMPVGPGPERTPAELAALAVSLGFDAYALVPEDYLERQGRDRVAENFDVRELAGYADYVYRTADLAGLEGRPYAKKRNLVRQFQRDFVDQGRVRVEAMTGAQEPECAAFLEAWCQERGCDKDPDADLACEKEANLTALRHLETLRFRGLLLRIDGRVSAFGMASRLTKDMGVLHFEKAFASAKGLYQYFDQLCAQRLFPGLEYVNKENDQGDAGLAKAKESYRPSAKVRSYRLTLRPAAGR
ncbi:MAG: hypothetical protein A2X36_08700 [Elusimicrobia bacterium GWA2_69_24]|nr:MAG: hypothetical protein A2X36_08700 [Elusimicrobia bacterium GWA2_69_24]